MALQEPPVHWFPRPLVYRLVRIPERSWKKLTDSPVTYTDCVEVTILRFFHLALWDTNSEVSDSLDGHGRAAFRVSKQKMCTLRASHDLASFFDAHPYIHSGSWYDKTEEGLAEREAWSLLLTRRAGITYVQHSAFEVDAVAANLYVLVRTFFPLAATTVPLLGIDAGPSAHASALAAVCAFFSTPDLPLSCRNISDTSTGLVGDSGFEHHGLSYDLCVRGVPLFRWVWWDLRTEAGGVTDEGHAELVDLRRGVRVAHAMSQAGRVSSSRWPREEEAAARLRVAGSVLM